MGYVTGVYCNTEGIDLTPCAFHMIYAICMMIHQLSLSDGMISTLLIFNGVIML